HVPSRKLVALLVVTLVVPTVNVTAGQAPVDPETRPSTSASCCAWACLISTRVARIEPSACLVPFTSTRAPSLTSVHVPSRKLVALLVVTLVVPTVNVTAGQAPVDPETRPSTSASCCAWACLISTRVARIEPSACLVPFTSTRAPSLTSVHVPSRKLVALLVVTLVVPTVNVTAGQAPVDPETRPSTSASCCAWACLISTRVARIEPSACLVPFTSTRAPSLTSVQTPSRKVVALLVVTLGVPTMNVRLGQVPVVADTTPSTSASCPFVSGEE